MFIVLEKTFIKHGGIIDERCVPTEPNDITLCQSKQAASLVIEKIIKKYNLIWNSSMLQKTEWGEKWLFYPEVNKNGGHVRKVIYLIEKDCIDEQTNEDDITPTTSK